MATIRPAENEDTLPVQRLVSDVFAEFGLGLLLHDVDAHLADPAGFFRQGGGNFWVVEEGGSIIATAGMLSRNEATAELKALYVQASARRQGWGRRLVEWVMAEARRIGKGRLILWSDTRFLDAHRLYRKLGFQPLGERDLHDIYNSREFGFERTL
jgi:N-acetylglutamate synthase-like GNAT family acetyltransferase